MKSNHDNNSDNPFKLAMCQMTVVENKQENIQKATDMIMAASKKGAKLVVLPEMFNCPYSNAFFPQYAEVANDSETLKAMKKTAKAAGVYLIAGTIPEKEKDKIYNTSFIIDPQGELLAKHRKMHLFDVDIPGKLSFKESDMLTHGEDVTVFNTPFCCIGVAVCYDMRFPELIRKMVLMGAELIVVPAAFNMITGPAHWKLIVRGRALDNQIYFAAISPARDIKASYIAYGHSMLAGPWGNILEEAEKDEQILYGQINLEEVHRVRRELPLLAHRRPEMYKI